MFTFTYQQQVLSEFAPDSYSRVEHVSSSYSCLALSVQ